MRGTGTAASNGTSDTASTSLTAQVRDAGDHGNDQASATRVAIPSTTAGTLTSRDRDYFRIEVGQAGSLRLETTSGLDTYGTLLRGDGSQVARNDDSGSNRNFRISMGSIGAGVYYLQVRGFHHTTIGPYNLEVSGTARGPGGLPAASAPTVSIDSIPAGDEGTAVQLAAALVGGTYDGAVDYTWSVSGGVLDNANLAAPTWTRPAVNADTDHTISLTVSVDGSGTNASSGTSDTASTSRTARCGTFRHNSRRPPRRPCPSMPFPPGTRTPTSSSARRSTAAPTTAPWITRGPQPAGRSTIQPPPRRPGRAPPWRRTPTTPCASRSRRGAVALLPAMAPATRRMPPARPKCATSWCCRWPRRPR